MTDTDDVQATKARRWFLGAFATLDQPSTEPEAPKRPPSFDGGAKPLVFEPRRPSMTAHIRAALRASNRRPEDYDPEDAA